MDAKKIRQIIAAIAVILSPISVIVLGQNNIVEKITIALVKEMSVCSIDGDE